MQRSPLQVLIIEDDPFMAPLLTAVFKRAQFEVTLIQDGQEALDRLQRHAWVPLVLIDSMLPRVNGFELLKALRELPQWNDTRVIFLNDKDQITDLKKAFALGADDYLAKPLNPDEVLARAQRFFNKTRTTSTGVSQSV